METIAIVMVWLMWSYAMFHLGVKSTLRFIDEDPFDAEDYETKLDAKLRYAEANKKAKK